MKRRFDPKNVKFPRSSQFSRVPNPVVQHGVNPFLTIEDKTSMRQVNAATRGTLESDSELKCARSTHKGLACTGTIRNLTVDDECLSFCGSHIQYIIRNFVNVATADQPHVYVYAANSVILFLMEWSERNQSWVAVGQDEKEFSCEQSRVGDCLVANFDFTSTRWKELELVWILPGRSIVTEKDIRVGDQVMALVNQHRDQRNYFVSRISNRDFVDEVVQEREQPREDPCADNLLQCFDFLRAGFLDPNCVGYCEENREANIREVLDLLTLNPLFGASEMRPGIVIGITREWTIRLLDQSGHVEASVESKNPVQYEAVAGTATQFDYGIEVYFTKQARQTRLTELWIQLEEERIPITQFEESDTHIQIQVRAAGPRGMQWANDADLDVAD